jgi:hypothetical protein
MRRQTDEAEHCQSCLVIWIERGYWVAAQVQHLVSEPGSCDSLSRRTAWWAAGGRRLVATRRVVCFVAIYVAGIMYYTGWSRQSRRDGGGQYAIMILETYELDSQRRRWKERKVVEAVTSCDGSWVKQRRVFSRNVMVIGS